MLMVTVFGSIGWFVLLIATGVVMAVSRRTVLPNRSAEIELNPASSFWLFAVVLLLGGFALLPVAQLEQKHAWHSQQMLRNDQIKDAVEYIAKQPRDAFPPHWDPPPKTAYGEHEPSVVSVLAEIRNAGGPAWLKDLYLEKLLTEHNGISMAVSSAEEGDPTVLVELLTYLRGKAQGSEWDFALAWNLQNKKLPPDVREKVDEFLKEWKNHFPRPAQGELP